jgi:Flp pilus assembly protein TadD
VRAFVAALSIVVASAASFGCAHQQTPREHALLRVARGDLAGGTAELETLRDRSPNDPVAWIDLGHAYELAHQYDRALDAYDHAADVAPKQPIGPREGGLRATAWGEWAAAKPRLQAAILRGDDDPETYHALGLVLLHLGDKEGARAAYTKGLATPLGDKDATCVLGLATLAVVEEDATAALRWYDELARRRPQHAGAQFGRAWALAQLGRFDEANVAISEAAALGGKPESVVRLRAWVEERRRANKS